MPHQCVHCGRILEKATKELLEGCGSCGGKFFFYIKEEQLEKLKATPNPVIEMAREEKEHIERDVREMAGVVEESEPVILDLESVRIIGPGKFEIDIVNLFNKRRPLIYKLEEGKYIIDLVSTLNKDLRDLKEIRDPDKL